MIFFFLHKCDYLRKKDTRTGRTHTHTHTHTLAGLIKIGICQQDIWYLTNYRVLNNTPSLVFLSFQTSSRISFTAWERAPITGPPRAPFISTAIHRDQMTTFSPLSRRWPVKPGQRAALHLPSFPPSLLPFLPPSPLALPNTACPWNHLSIAPNLKSQSPFFKCIAFQRLFFFSFFLSFFFLLQESLGQQSIRGGVIEGAVRG